MKSAWNLVGMGLWLILIVYLIWMIHDMRARRLKLIVTQKKTFTWENFTRSAIELVVFLLALWGMSYATFFQDVAKLNKNAVTTSYEYKPLILQYGENSHYVTISNSKGRKPIQTYTYYVDGGKFEVFSSDATISYGKNPLSVPAEAYKWNKEWLTHLDSRYQNAWVGTVTTTYKKNFINGIGLHAGRQANRFNLIRIPDKSFMKVEAK
ncbi:LVIS_2131 family protein [Lentilactobacillus sp. Marseille-Q4993]|uniref:LVIS_2131 family protein n=1 Tax=Lentilactobacillus sp. Marseille-Q4993 TaxID=3039492 RepID=UPI0024BD3694|nr:LVIS_2131 family protein [Lentilactobacillus sp. Marseille-Q4993]